MSASSPGETPIGEEPLEGCDLVVRSEGRVHHVTPRGDLDLASCDELDQTLTQLIDAADEVTVDLREVPFVDSSGLATLVKAARQAAGSGCGFRVADAQPQARRLFELARVGGILGLSDHG